MPRPAALYNRRKWQLIGKSQWFCSANCGHPLHALTYNWTHGMQLANTSPLQSTTPGLHPVSFHQMAPPMRGNTHTDECLDRGLGIISPILCMRAVQILILTVYKTSQSVYKIFEMRSSTRFKDSEGDQQLQQELIKR